LVLCLADPGEKQGLNKRILVHIEMPTIQSNSASDPKDTSYRSNHLIRVYDQVTNMTFGWGQNKLY